MAGNLHMDLCTIPGFRRKDRRAMNQRKDLELHLQADRNRDFHDLDKPRGLVQEPAARNR